MLVVQMFRQEMLKPVHKGQEPWAIQHLAAVARPMTNPTEANRPGMAILSMLSGLAIYADWHRGRFGSDIADDGVIGREWREALGAVRGLLNGELSGLDAGTVDSTIVEMGKAAGFKD